MWKLCSTCIMFIQTWCNISFLEESKFSMTTDHAHRMTPNVIQQLLKTQVLNLIYMYDIQGSSSKTTGVLSYRPYHPQCNYWESIAYILKVDVFFNSSCAKGLKKEKCKIRGSIILTFKLHLTLFAPVALKWKHSEGSQVHI